MKRSILREVSGNNFERFNKNDSFTTSKVFSTPNTRSGRRRRYGDVKKLNLKNLSNMLMPPLISPRPSSMIPSFTPPLKNDNLEKSQLGKRKFVSIASNTKSQVNDLEKGQKRRKKWSRILRESKPGKAKVQKNACIEEKVHDFRLLNNEVVKINIFKPGKNSRCTCCQCNKPINFSENQFCYDIQGTLNEVNHVWFPSRHPQFMAKVRKTKVSMNRICVNCEEILKIKIVESINQVIHLRFKNYLDSFVRECDKLKYQLNIANHSLQLKEDEIKKLKEDLKSKIHQNVEDFAKRCIKQGKEYIKNDEKKEITLYRASLFDIKKEKEKQVNQLLFQFLNSLQKHSRGENSITDKAKLKIQLMLQSVFNICLKMMDLGYVSTFQLLNSLLVHQYGRSDVCETVLNHVGLGVCPSYLDTFLMAESKKRSYGRKLRKSDYVHVFVLDNNQRIGKTSRLTQDIKKKTIVITNLTYFNSNKMIKKEINKMHFNMFLSDENINNVKFCDTCFCDDDDKVLSFSCFQKFVQAKEEMKAENALFNMDFIKYYIKESDTLITKSCCGVNYSDDKRKCDKCKGKLGKIGEMRNEKAKFDVQIKGYVKKVIKHFNEGKITVSEDSRKLETIQGYTFPPTGKNMPVIVNDISKFSIRGGQNNFIVIEDGLPNATVVAGVIKNPVEWGYCWPSNGLMHTRKELTGLFYQVLIDFSPEVVDICGFDQKHDWLKKVKDLHKCTDFLSVIQISFLKELIYEYSKFKGITVQKVEFDKFYKDASFVGFEYGYWVLCTSSALLLFLEGTRTGGKGGHRMINSAIRYLMDLVFMKPCDKYQKVLMFEEIRKNLLNLIIHYKDGSSVHGSKMIDLLNESSLLPNKNGFFEETDAKLEEENRVQKFFYYFSYQKKLENGDEID